MKGKGCRVCVMRLKKSLAVRIHMHALAGAKYVCPIRSLDLTQEPKSIEDPLHTSLAPLGNFGFEGKFLQIPDGWDHNLPCVTFDGKL
jgi:hypothetical protein